MDRTSIYTLIDAERARQDATWGGPEHDSRKTLENWVVCIATWLGKAGAAALRGDERQFIIELIAVAALCIAALEQAPGWLFAPVEEATDGQ